ncbi:MAG: hypothetical protein V3S53_05555 [Gammaproteobacteria bacterium]
MNALQRLAAFAFTTLAFFAFVFAAAAFAAFVFTAAAFAAFVFAAAAFAAFVFAAAAFAAFIFAAATFASLVTGFVFATLAFADIGGSHVARAQRGRHERAAVSTRSAGESECGRQCDANRQCQRFL